MNLSSVKTFTHKAKDYTSFYNETGEPRVNVEGVVEVVGGVSAVVDNVDVTVAGGVSSSCYIGKSSTATNGDFAVAYTSATELTLSAYPPGVGGITSTDIEAIRQINASGEVIATYHRDDTVMSVTGDVITVADAAFGATDTFVIFTNIARPTSAGAGGAGGGSIVYTNAAGDFVATPTTGAKTITITGLSFTLEAINVVSGSIKRIVSDGTVIDLDLSDVSVAGGVITLDNIDNFTAGDVIYATFIGPDKAYDQSLDVTKIVVQNPDYGHYTSVETLVDEADVAGKQATGDAGGDATHIVDADGAFTVASTAVGYLAHNVTEATSAEVLSVDSATQVTTDTGATDWASDAYVLPLVKRYEINMESYDKLSLHYYMRNGANLNAYLKIYGTNNTSATVDADTSWVDMSADLFGDAAGINCVASTTVEGMKFVTTKSPILKFMVKLVVECAISSGHDNDYEVYIKKSY